MEGSTFLPPPERFEAGVPAAAQAQAPVQKRAKRSTGG